VGNTKKEVTHAIIDELKSLLEVILKSDIVYPVSFKGKKGAGRIINERIQELEKTCGKKRKCFDKIINIKNKIIKQFKFKFNGP